MEKSVREQKTFWAINLIKICRRYALVLLLLACFSVSSLTFSSSLSWPFHQVDQTRCYTSLAFNQAPLRLRPHQLKACAVKHNLQRQKFMCMQNCKLIIEFSTSWKLEKFGKTDIASVIEKENVPCFITNDFVFFLLTEKYFITLFMTTSQFVRLMKIFILIIFHQVSSLWRRVFRVSSFRSLVF